MQSISYVGLEPSISFKLSLSLKFFLFMKIYELKTVLSNCLQVAKTIDLVKAKGGKVIREPGPVKGGNTIIAFVEDPDGYKFELLERGPTPEPLCQVMLRVGDLDQSINFYKKVGGFLLVKEPLFH